MYICHDCKRTFDTPKTYYEHHPYGMGYASERWDVCPYCGEADFDEAKTCSSCGDYVEELEDGFCQVCWEEKYGDEDYEEE